jgi:hypothetical protein
LAAFVIAVLRYKKLEPSWLRLFIWFTLLTFLIQIGGELYVVISRSYYNAFIFNAYIVVEYGFYLWVIYKALRRAFLKKIVWYMLLLFILFWMAEVFLWHPFSIFAGYNFFTNNIGEFLTILACIFYLSELLMADDIVNFFSLPMFWITTGIMIEAVGVFLYLAFYDFIIQNKLDPYGPIYSLMTTICTVLEFAFFSIGFLCNAGWKRTN